MIAILGIGIVQQSVTAGHTVFHLSLEADLVESAVGAGDAFDAGVVVGAGGPAGGEAGGFDGENCWGES